MIVEIVSTGTELLLGQIVNTNAVYLAQRLNTLGFDVLYQTTIGDNRDRMSQVLTTALNRADIVITSGGLGPTQGDITKEVTASVLGLPLHLHQPSVERIKDFFASRNLVMPENNLRQAMLPQGARAIENSCGTAPGVIIESHGKIIIHLPGPPTELKHMFEQHIEQYLLDKFGFQGTIFSHVLKLFGIGESKIDETLGDLIRTQENPTIALLAKDGEIHIRLTAKAPTVNAAQNLINPIELEIRRRLGNAIFGSDLETLESIVGVQLINKGATITLAESCTGGLVSSRLTDVPGSSAYLLGSIVCYSNEVKTNLLKVPEDLLAAYGAVSSHTANSMAQNVRNLFGTTVGIGITGIAGPGGATDGKPVGLVYIAIDGPAGLECCQYNFNGQRKSIKFRTSQAALDLLRRYMLKF